MHNTTPYDFLSTVFPPYLLTENERPVVAYPASFVNNAGELVEYYRQFHPGKGDIPSGIATYFCVSTVQHQRKRQVKKRLEDVRHAMALVVDDVGTKSAWPPVECSWALETSEGNFQVGWLLEPFDVSTPEGRTYYDTCLCSLAAAGFNDPGFRSASRLARLPGSVHRSGFTARLTQWRDYCWKLEDLMEDFLIPLVRAKRAFTLPEGQHRRLESVEDHIYDWLVDNWKIYGHNGEWVYIECPWRDEHTEGRQGATSTAFSPLDYGRKGRGFKCLHGHCADRQLQDFASFVAWRRVTAALPYKLI
jgi:hypothetical protein